MNEGIVSKKIYSKAVKAALSSGQIEEQLKRMSREEPVLYAEAFKDVQTVLTLLRTSEAGDVLIRGIDHALGALIARVYIAMKMGTTDLWLDVSGMRNELNKHWGPDRNKPGNDGQSTNNDSYL